MIGKLHYAAYLLALLAAGPLSGCKSYAPVKLEVTDWAPDMARQTTADFSGNLVTLHNVRHAEYRSSSDCDVTWYDKVVDLDKIRTVDFIMVPFGGVPGIAHTMLSYGFDDDAYLGVSVEIRRRVGEVYNPAKGLENHYPLQYVFADESDLIGRRAIYDLDDVYLYRANATAEQARAMFVSMCERANKLAVDPEYYNTIFNNCTTNIVRHVNEIAKRERVPFTVKGLFPGYSDRLAYQLGLIASDKSFDMTKQAARVNEKVYAYRNDPNFSRMIRR